MQTKLNDEGVLPARHLVFRPFIETPLHRVKVMIVGAEPYSLRGKPDGLAYSCQDEIRTDDDFPTSLLNLFIELTKDTGVPMPKVGSLRRWARQGVLLWNASLTVQKGFPHSHMVMGWDLLTKEVMETVYLVNPDTVFIFWDAKTRDYSLRLPKGINQINTAGPAVHTAYAGFFGSHPFTKTNEMLKRSGQTEIDWRVY